MSPELVDWMWRAAIGLVIGLILYAVKDRRRTANENKLAEDTMQPRVKKVGIEVLESQILAMSTAWDQERISKDRRFAELLEEHTECRGRIERAEATIGEMKAKAETMAAELEEFKRQLATFTEAMGDTP